MQKHNSVLNKNETVLFFKRLIKNPRKLGAVMPSSKALAYFISQHVHMRHPDEFIIEVGAGTGSFTRCLLENGVDPQKLILIELDSELCAYLKQQFPTLTILQGDACQLEALLPVGTHHNISTIISGIPLINLSTQEQKTLFDAFKNVLNSKGCVLQFTYGPLSPLPHKKFGFQAKRLGIVLRNVPPATVWSYSIAESPSMPITQFPTTLTLLQKMKSSFNLLQK